MQARQTFTLRQKIAAWSIHAFTASGAFIAVMTLFAISQHQFIWSLWLICIAIVIDAVDGMMARACRVKEVVPTIDGALLDNIIDFANYTLIPCFFILISDLLLPAWRVPCVFIITMASAYQFTQTDAKTRDHFFKGFPSYWNIAVFYLYFWQMSSIKNLYVLLILAALSFVPIKYIYPTRLDYMSSHPLLRTGMGIGTIAWGVVSVWLLWLFPATNHLLVALSLGYIIFYFCFSLYRTLYPVAMGEMILE